MPIARRVRYALFLLALPAGFVAAQHIDATHERPLMDVPGIIALLERAGYTRVSEVDREGALWEIEAVDRDGKRVELLVNGHDGRVLHSEREFPDFGFD